MTEKLRFGIIGCGIIGRLHAEAIRKDEHLQRFERAIVMAHTLQTPYIRIFSFYPPASSLKETGDSSVVNPAEYRDEVLRRLREMTARARAAGVILLHENEKGIYGDTIARCVDLLLARTSPRPCCTISGF